MAYNHKEIEKKWQNYWDENEIFKTDDFVEKPKYYILDMYPYPSGSGLHVGHPLGYIATDILARYKRHQGYNVLHPMGWDAFGLPAEQYAIKTGTHPSITTKENIDNFKRQIKMLGFSYDWKREINTTDPGYVKWTQWIFIQLFNKGLAYEAEVPVNWCPELKAVLANEEVVDGKSDIGGHPVLRVPMRQWMLRITKYAESLLSGLDDVDWPHSIKELQRNWIGRSEGANVLFELPSIGKKLEVFTTRHDTLFGATYIVIAPEHPLVKELVTEEQKNLVTNYIEKTSTKSDLDRTELNKDKSGVFLGCYAINPVNSKQIPIWISDYVIMGYGTGAIMAVPGEDERDWDFATKYELPIVRTVEPSKEFSGGAFTGDGPAINSEFLNGLFIDEAKEKMALWLENNKKGERTVQYKLRDWLFSRQRYWGEPIPVIHKNDKVEALNESDLPLELPDVEKYEPSGTGESPLATIKSWVEVKDKNDNLIGLRETNTMPQWAGSCWYYLRYLDPNNEEVFAETKKIKYWMPVDLYIGGAEHAVLHLLYSRFWHKVLYDLNYLNTKEPFKKLVNQGMILGRSSFVYRIKGSNKYVSYNLRKRYDYTRLHVDVSFVENDQLNINKFKNSSKELKDSEFILEKDKYICGSEIEKMSKSKSNVVNPDKIIKKYGADTLRMYEMFLGPIEQSKPWNTNGIEGVFKFLNKFWNLFHIKNKFEVSEEKANSKELKILHNTIKKIEEDIERLSINTCISQLMITINELIKLKCNKKEILKPMIIVCSPFAPHICEELWEKIGNKKSVTKEIYPEYNSNYLVESEYEYPIMINGKLRSKQRFALDLKKQEIEELVMKNQTVIKWIKGNRVKKIITVPNKIINIVF